jgi:HlyD family secretion protein
VVIGVVVVVVGGGAAAAWAATRPAGADYRVATAAPASVTATLAETGTIQPVSQATVMFPTSGQVSSVAVTVGQHVTVGQQLAQLNTTSLNDAVSSAQATVATAQAKLADDQTSQTTATDTAQTTTPSSASTGSHGASGGGQSGQSGQSGLSADQSAVRKTQQRVDSDLALVAAADHKVTAQGAACQSLLAELKDPPATSTTTPVAPTTESRPTTSVGDCETLINEVLTDESKTGADEHTLATAVTKLSTDLNKEVAAVGKSAQQSTSTPGGSGGSGASGGSGGSGASGGSGGSLGSGRSAQPVTAAQIAADQASIDAANAELAVTKQNLSAASLTSPLAGTVADVTMTAGQSATANSSAAEVVVIGGGQDEVTTAVTDAQVGQVKPGEHATVTPDGATQPITGTVTQIGALGTTTSSGSASYPVTISLDSSSQRLFDGATATVRITLSKANAAVTVPTSAIRTIGGFSVVTKLTDGKPTLTRITLGVQGPVVTQVTSGLTAGDEVALADINAPMPTTGNTPGGAARFAGGAGGAGGGFARAAAGGGR